mgnify:CR=1 FL=1
MGSLKKTALLATAALMAASTAHAADLLDPPIFNHTPEIIPAEVGSNWYLRGDIGYSVNRAPSGRVVGGPLFNEGVDNTWMAGIGFGYQFNEYFRTDATLDYHHTFDFTATTPCAGACVNSLHSADISAWTLMANAYLDFGTWEGLTPYIGAGIGGAYVSVDGHSVRTPGVGTVNYSGGDRWALAAAAMAGASYTITDNLLLDAGYRYLWIDGAKSGSAVGGVVPGNVNYDDLQSHELRLGLRYLID